MLLSSSTAGQSKQYTLLCHHNPKGIICSALLFTLYADDCRTTSDHQYILKYADDTVVLVLLSNTDSPRLHQCGQGRDVELKQRTGNEH